jgi:hypothetical protein
VILFGVRAGVGLAAAGVALGGVALAVLLGGGSDGEAAPTGAAPRAQTVAARPERAAQAAAGRGTRVRVGALELGGRLEPRAALERPAADAGRSIASGAGTGAPQEELAAGASRIGGAAALAPAGSALAAFRPALAPARPARGPRPGEVVSLEREALRSLSALDREDADALAAAIEAEVAALEPEPGESPRDVEDRREDARGQLAADELLLRARLAELYAQQVYPYGFPAERIVEPMERQWIESLPAADRAEALRRLAGSEPPGKPQPRFESPESGLVYEGGPGL